jgi:hypothetical protein
MNALIRTSLAATLAASVACTVQQTDVPGLTGPSEFATSIRLTATPDTIRHDGVDSSSMLVSVVDVNGAPVAGLQLRVDIIADGGPADYGVLSQRTVSTGSDGRARFTYTAPPAPPINSPLNTCAPTIFSPYLLSGCVEIVATPIGTNFAGRPSEAVRIHLTPSSVITPPADPTAPVAAFTITTGSAVRRYIFNASASTAFAGRTIVRYEWFWGDGESAVRTDPNEDHDYPLPGVYPVTLKVTDSAGVTGSVTQVLSAF